eukprot:s497_g20.t1
MAPWAPWHAAAFAALLRADAERAPRLLLSRPRQRAGARYYPFRQLLDCEGSNFSAPWRSFREKVAENAREGFPVDAELLTWAKQIHSTWEDEVRMNLEHCGATILHAAAFSEFREHVRRLAGSGDMVGAYLLWANAVEVLHSPFQAHFDIEIQGLPLLCRAPCTLPNCVRCDQQLGGFKFPWLGTWNSRGVVVPPGVNPDEAWRRYYENPEPMDLLLVSAYSEGVTAKDVAPQCLYELQLRIVDQQTGPLGMGEFLAAWRDWIMCFESRSFPAEFWDPRAFPRSPRGRPWQAFGEIGCRAQRSLCGWLDAQCTRHFDMGTGCLDCGDPTYRVCFGCSVGLCLDCFPLRRPCPVCGERGKMCGGDLLLPWPPVQHDCKGYYAAQAASSSSAGGDPDQGWSAEDSLQQVAAHRARQWREAHGLELDSDFAYAYVDYDHVVGAAGHHVADAWLAVRAAQEESLLHEGAKVIESKRQPMPFKPVRKQHLKKKPQTQKTGGAATEADQRRVTGLVSVEADLHKDRPKEGQGCREGDSRPCGEHVAGASSIPGGATGPKGQAPVAEPPLIQALEQRIEELFTVGDERWSVLLGCWMMCFGCLRYVHITRSEPRKLTASFLHCRCQKGKQQQLREGFDFAIPAHFLTGWYWAKEVVEAWRSLAPSRQRAAGLCFSEEGRPWTIKEVQESMQVEMGVLVDNPEDLTTYSWRREKSQLPETGRMALHYSSAKYAASLRVKALVWGATPSLGDHLSWDSITPEMAEEAKQAGLAEREKFLRQDRNPVWASTNSFQDFRKRLKLSQKFVQKAEKAREEAASSTAPKMPASLAGKVLTATLKNGQPLCPNFQTDSCTNEAGSCPLGAHLCAALQQSGRACGGKHGAEVCHSKRVVKASTPLPSTPGPSSTKVPAATGGRAAFGRKRPAEPDEEASSSAPAPKVPKAKGSARPKSPVHGPKAKPKTVPVAAITPAAKKAQAKPAAPGRPVSKAKAKGASAAEPARGEGDALDQHLEWLGVGTGTAQSPTCIWTSRTEGQLWLSGLVMTATQAKFPKPALQVCCFPHGPANRGGIVLPGAHLIVFEAAYSHERNQQWSEVWPAVKHTLWNGDPVLIHCIKGRHRGAFLGVLCRALLANRHIEDRRNTQLHKVVQDKGMKKWLHETYRSTNVGSPHPDPVGYAATDTSSAHITIADGCTLCKHKQADGKAKRLVNPYTACAGHRLAGGHQPEPEDSRTFGCCANTAGTARFRLESRIQSR